MNPTAVHERIPTASLRLYFSATIPEEARRLVAAGGRNSRRASASANDEPSADDDPTVWLSVFALAGPGVAMRRPVGRTEPIDLSRAIAAGQATWMVPVPVEYRFEVTQRFEVAVVAGDFEAHRIEAACAMNAAAAMPAPTPSPGASERLGAGSFTLAHLAGSRGSRLAVALKGNCRVTVHAEEVTRHQRDTAAFTFACRGLTRKGCFGAFTVPSAVLVLSRVQPTGMLKELWRSPPAPSGSDPTWPSTSEIVLPDLTIGESFDTRCVLVQVFHAGLFGDTSIGEARLSHADLTRSGDRGGAIEFFLQLPGSAFPLTDSEHGATAIAHAHQSPSAALGGRYDATTAPGMSPRTAEQAAIPLGDCDLGSVRVTLATATHVPTFNELLDAGMEVNLAAAVDFTASNGDPDDPTSLHRCLGTAVSADNQYARAIHSVCDILMEYDTDKLVPAFGFGAQLPIRGQFLPDGSGAGRIRAPVTSHCFHLNGQPDPHVHGVQGLLDAYARAVASLRFSGPTYFADIVRRATAAAVASPGAYTVLLILTDGCINDTDATIDAIVEAGDAPLSIIIVGVGNADFTLMDRLDGDAVRLANRFGIASKRDLVQFVPFRDFANGPRWQLAAEVLQEVPAQVEEWAKTHRITVEHFDAQSWASGDVDGETRMREVRSPSPPGTPVTGVDGGPTEDSPSARHHHHFPGALVEEPSSFPRGQ